MGAVLKLTAREVSEDDVLRAWAALRALVLAETNDPDLVANRAHLAALLDARDRFEHFYREWRGQPG